MSKKFEVGELIVYNYSFKSKPYQPLVYGLVTWRHEKYYSYSVRWINPPMHHWNDRDFEKNWNPINLSKIENANKIIKNGHE